MITSSILLGAIVTGLVQWLKSAMATSKVGTLFILAMLSIVFAIGGAVLAHFNLLSLFWGIIGTATTIYAFIVQFLEQPADVTAA